MRTKLMGWVVLVVVIMAGSVQAAPVWAADESLAPPRSYAHGAMTKLGRGAANVVTAPLELLRVPMLVSRKDGGLAGISVGVARGAWAGLVREAAGLIEVITFPVPIPKNFEPLVRPEFIYAHGEWVEN